MPTVRRAKISDIANVASLVGQYWEFEHITGFVLGRTEDHLSSLFSLPERGACWVVESAGATVGYLIAVFVFSLEHGGLMAEIDEFFVAPQCRSGGAGSALLVEAERDMRSSGLVHLQLQLGVANNHARRFYERHGFQKRSNYELLDKSLSV